MAETSISGIEFKIVGSTGKAKTAVDKLTSSLKGLKTALSSARTAKLEKELEGIDKNAKKSTTTLGKLFKSVGRIGFYRAIRSALKFITEGFREGLQNAYQFSKIVGYDLAATMDNLATKSLTMKNQLGSAFGSLIMAVEPILLQLIALVTRAANALAQFFAAIGGKETYLKAIDTVTQYGKAVGGVGQAAKEAMRYLAPFDELNVLPAQNEPGGGGGGASTPDYSQMFEESPVMQKLAEFGASLKLSFNDMFIDWDDLTPEQISEKIIGAILGLTGFLAGIAITGSLTGGLVVGIAGVATALVFNSVVFDHDGKIDKGELQSMLRLALIGITGGLIGFAIGGPGGALIGASIGFGLDALLEAINFFTDGKLEGAMEGLVRGISAGLGGVIGFMIGGPAGAVLGATIGLGISFGLENFIFGDTTGWSTGDWIRNIVATLAPVAGAAIGLVVGGPMGALIGATIGLGIQFALNADTTDGAENSGKTIGEKILEGIGKPFKTIGDWIKEHIIDPIKEKIKGFSLTKLLFGGDDGETTGTGVEVEITGVKDSIPKEKRTIGDMVAGFVNRVKSNGFKNTLGEMVAGFNNRVKSSGFNSTLGEMIAGFKGRVKSSGFNSTLGDMIAGFKGRVKSSGFNSTIGEMIANFTSKKSSLSLADITWRTLANFTSKKNSLTTDDVTFGAKANFNTWKNSLTDVWSYAKSWFNTWENDNISPWSYAKSWFNTWDTQYGETPWANAKSWFKWFQFDVDDPSGVWSWADAWFNHAYDNIPASEKEIPVTARFTNTSGGGTFLGYAKGGAYYGGSWHDIPQAASGGRFHGSLVWAGENGPEVLGHAGGRTEILNRSQLAATMYAAVKSAMSGFRFNVGSMNVPSASADSYDEEALYRAMLRALNDSDVADSEITLDGDVLYRKMVQRNQMNTRMTGRNVMATA